MCVSHGAFSGAGNEALTDTSACTLRSQVLDLDVVVERGAGERAEPLHEGFGALGKVGINSPVNFHHDRR